MIERREGLNFDSNEIIDKVIISDGSTLRESLMNEISENDIRLIMLFGPPKGGKTTIALQLSNEIEINSSKITDLIFFDNALSKTKDKFNLKPIPEWEDDEWNLASDFYFNQIENKINNANPDTIVIAENVGTGITNRGNSTLEKLSKIHKIDAFYLALVNDPRIAEKATNIRSEILRVKQDGKYSISNGEIIEYLYKNNLIINGVDEYSASEAGEIIRSAVLSMDLSDEPNFIAKTLKQEKDMIFKSDNYRKRGLPKGNKRISEIEEIGYAANIQIMRGESGNIVVPIPQQILNSGLSSEQLSVMGIQVAYYNNIRSELGLSKDRFKIIFNNFTNDKVHYLDLNKIRGN